MTPEGRVKADILGWIKKLEDMGLPLMHDVRQAGGLNYRKGSADIWCVFNGHHIEVETKRREGQQASLQEVWERKCKAVNIPYILANDFEKFKNDFIKLMEQYSD